MSVIPENTAMDAPISDEILMAYADGALPPAEREAVSKALAQSPELMQRLESFLFTRGPMPRVFDAALAAPIPEKLLAILRAPSPPASARPAPARGSSILAQLAATFRMAVFSPAGAMATLVVGVAAGWLLQSGTRSDLVRLDIHGLTATASLQRALETAPPGGSVAVAGGLSLKPTLTFRSTAKSWCRQFDLVDPQGAQATGIACREGGVWHVIAQTGAAPAASSDGKIVPADRPESILDSLRAELKEGDALGRADEDALVRRHWRDGP